MLMHPYIAEQLMRQRAQELHHASRREMPTRPVRRRRHSMKYRTGWMLVEIGLALLQRSPVTDRRRAGLGLRNQRRCLGAMGGLPRISLASSDAGLCPGKDMTSQIPGGI
jgi:hypothetical protein